MGISSTGTRAFVFDYGGTLLHKEKVCRWLGEEREKEIWIEQGILIGIEIGIERRIEIRIRIRRRCSKSYVDDDDGDGDWDGRILGEGNETEIINWWYENE